MRVKEIRVYPIKSIRGISLQSHETTASGFEYDRIFMLQRVEDNLNMQVSKVGGMCLFSTAFAPNNENPEKLVVKFGLEHTFNAPEKKLPASEGVLEIPLRPDVSTLKQAEVNMYTSATQGYVMDDKICKWFSDRFGFEVRLNYIGANKRQVLGNLNPNAPRSYVGDPDPRKEAAKQASPGGGYLDSVKTGIGSLVGTVASYAGGEAYKGVEQGLKFNDIAAFLVVNEKSHEEVQGRIQTNVDIEKFRPNIVVEGAEDAWVEDYWGEISIGSDETGTRIVFTSNCPRCASINVDYATGKPAEGSEGQLLKSLQSDRRIDPGAKYSPIFGRYGFLSRKNGTIPDKPITISVGDEVQVTKTNERKTHFYWPSVGT